MPEISISIMAVPWRLQQVRSLIEQLGPVPVSWDHHRRGIWPNARHAWQMYTPDATHHLVLQDDTQVCPNFRKHLARLVEANPCEIITLWGGHNKHAGFEYALKNNLSWWVGEVDVRVVACIMPVPLIQSWLAWCDAHISPLETQYDDMRLDAWMLVTKRMYWQTVPELVEHLGATQSTTRVNHPGRVAYSFQEPREDQDWTLGLVPEKTFCHNKASYLSYLKEYSL